MALDHGLHAIVSKGVPLRQRHAMRTAVSRGHALPRLPGRFGRWRPRRRRRRRRRCGRRRRGRGRRRRRRQRRRGAFGNLCCFAAKHEVAALVHAASGAERDLRTVQYSCGRSVAARVRAGCAGAGCEGLRGAPHAPRTPICPHRRTRPSFSSVSHPRSVGQSGCPLRLLAPTSRTCLRTQGRAGACWAHAVWKGRRRVRRKGLAGKARACGDAASFGEAHFIH